MSNIKLKDHNWAAEGIYDTNQSKSQQTINSDVSTKIGQATLQTSSQNLSGATNELKGRADTLDSKYDNVVTVANTQPSSEYNKVWLPLTVSEGTQVPTWAEHQALESSLNGAIKSTDSSLAISIQGNTNNTGTQIEPATFIILKGHSSFPDGAYIAAAQIANGASITSANVISLPNGIGNYLKFDRITASSNQTLTSVIQSKFDNGGNVFGIIPFNCTGSVYSDFPSGVGSYGAGLAVMAGYYHTAYYQSTSGDFYMGIKSYAATAWTWTKIH